MRGWQSAIGVFVTTCAWNNTFGKIDTSLLISILITLQTTLHQQILQTTLHQQIRQRQLQLETASDGDSRIWCSNKQSIQVRNPEQLQDHKFTKRNLQTDYDVLSPFQIVGCFVKFRYINFAMHLVKHYMSRCMQNASKFAKTNGGSRCMARCI